MKLTMSGQPRFVITTDGMRLANAVSKTPATRFAAVAAVVVVVDHRQKLHGLLVEETAD